MNRGERLQLEKRERARKKRVAPHRPCSCKGCSRRRKAYGLRITRRDMVDASVCKECGGPKHRGDCPEH